MDLNTAKTEKFLNAGCTKFAASLGLDFYGAKVGENFGGFQIDKLKASVGIARHFVAVRSHHVWFLAITECKKTYPKIKFLTTGKLALFFIKRIRARSDCGGTSWACRTSNLHEGLCFTANLI